MKTFYKSLLRSAALSVFFVSAISFSSHATKVVVTVQNFSFTPSSFTVSLGDTIQWKWVNGTHTTTSQTIPGGAATWNANINSATQTFNYVPAVVGTYNYHCGIHPTTMIASFSVVCGTPSLTIAASGPTTVCKPATVTLAITTSSGGPFTTFQWKKGTNNVAGATNATFTATSSGSYKLVVTNGCAATATSNTVSVTVNAQPAATITPGGTVSICQGQTTTLTANTGANLIYQWKKGSNNIAGATNSTLVVGSAATYKVNVTNTVTGCSKLSKGTKVVINCKEAGLAASSITVFPNPSSDFFELNTAMVQSAGSYVDIYDLTGKLMEHNLVTGATTTVGRTLPSGFYLAKIEVNGKTTQVVKLMKN
jgi:plastocyanin